MRQHVFSVAANPFPLNLTPHWHHWFGEQALTCETVNHSKNIISKQSSAFAVDFDICLWLSCNKLSFSYNLQGVSLSDQSNQRESGTEFMPKYDAQGLLTAVVTNASTDEVLMVAFMDEEALAATRESGEAHFHSRSRGRLWKKGESSGNVLKVEEILVDCDQDALVLRCRPAGPTCHTGAVSCFYRRLEGSALQRVNS